MDVEQIRGALECRSLVVRVDRLPRGHARVQTTFRYPDRSSVDLFVKDDGGLFPPSVLTDFGQTTAWLLDMQIKPWLSKKRRTMVEDVLHAYSVRQNGGAFEVDFANLDELEPKVVTLAQACLRISDLMFTKRASLQTSFFEDVEDFLSDVGVEYEPNAELPGPWEAPVKVDFLAKGKRRDSALLTVSSGNPSGAHQVLTEVFRKWHDLLKANYPANRVTVYDDRYDAYRSEDMKRLADYCELMPFSSRADLVQLLEAA